MVPQISSITAPPAETAGREHLCAICAGTSHDPVGGEVDPDLKTVYSSVLPICTICKSHGAKIVVGRYGKNGRTIEESLDKKRRAEAAKAAKAAE